MINKCIVKLFAISIFFISCLSVRPGAVKSGKSLYITYSSGKGNTIYYIKPLDFYNQTEKTSIDFDLTFRYSNVLDDTASLKFSIYDQTVIKKIDSVKIENGMISVVSKNCTHMFSDRANKQYVNRFETLVPLPLIRDAFNKSDWSYIVYRGGKTYVYRSSNKTQKKIERLKTNVFVVL